ncbi:MAG: extracellular solute-binding protein, partial [Clostridia bacterium]|nr:extracellular solute-binding protein [Clostridia bacterium]
MSRKIIPFMMILLLFSLAACGNRSVGEEQTAKGNENNPFVKTNIFKETAFPLPDGAELYMNVTPYWDAKAGELTYLAKTTAETETLDGSWSVFEIPVLVTADLCAGEIKSATELPGSAVEGPAEGAIYADEAVIVLATPNRHYRLMRFNRKKKKAEISETINSLFPRQVLGIAGAVRDADGNTAVLSQDELLVVDKSWKAVRSAILPPDTQAEGLMTLPDGTILARCTDRSGATGYAFYDAENARFGDFISDERIPVPCGSEFDYCYGLYINDGTGGIFGVNPDEEAPVCLLNYINSGIQGAALWFAADRDTMIFTVDETDTLNASFSRRPVLYMRGEDIDISNARILHLAIANTSLSLTVTRAISDFNRTHADVQIEINDYTEFADGENRLAMDMVTGVFKPDILLGDETSSYLLTAAEKGLYTDLSPYLDADPLITRDNLFDAVERVFDDGEGGLWGLSTNFAVSMT